MTSANAIVATLLVAERGKSFNAVVVMFLSVIHLTTQRNAATWYPLLCGVLCCVFTLGRILLGRGGGHREAHHRCLWRTTALRQVCDMRAQSVTARIRDADAVHV